MSSLFGGSQEKAPEPKPPTPMPDPESPAVREARRRKAVEQFARGGRSSTILSGGGGDYTGTKLGTT